MSIPSAKPTVRKISARALTYAIAGAESAYPVYQFSEANKYERPHSNPFAGIAVGPARPPYSSSK